MNYKSILVNYSTQMQKYTIKKYTNTIKLTIKII